MKRILTFLLLFLIAFSPLNTLCVSANDETYENTDKLELKRCGELKYYLYTPTDPTDQMPLIVYLHGGTNKNLDVTALLG